MKEEENYGLLLDAIQYRREQLMERLNQKNIPTDIRGANEERLQKLEEWRDILFY